MVEFLFFIMGAGWIVAYLLIIRRNFLDRACGIPFVALGANLVWEWLHVTMFPLAGSPFYYNLLWGILDAIIIFQCILYTPKGERLRKASLLSFLMVVFACILIAGENYSIEVLGSALGQNLMMSVLFVWVLLQKKSVAGQSFYIAICKAVGTWAVIVILLNDPYIIQNAAISMSVASIGIIVFDVLYMVLIWRQLVQEKINPLKRL